MIRPLTLALSASLALLCAGCNKPASSELPAACESYLARATACYDKAGASAAAMKQGLDQLRTRWKALADPQQMEEACKVAEAQFAAVATNLGCE